MSFGGSSKPKLPQPEKVEEIQQVKEDETEAAKRERRKLITSGGRQSTIISGLREQLKQRLGQ